MKKSSPFVSIVIIVFGLLVLWTCNREPVEPRRAEPASWEAGYEIGSTLGESARQSGWERPAPAALNGLAEQRAATRYFHSPDARRAFKEGLVAGYQNAYRTR